VYYSSSWGNITEAQLCFRGFYPMLPVKKSLKIKTKVFWRNNAHLAEKNNAQTGV